MTSEVQNSFTNSNRTNTVRKKKTMTTVEEFENWQKKTRSQYNYEFYYGQISKKQSMKQIELKIAQFLTRRFAETQAYKELGELAAEVDTYIDIFRKRVPDLAFFTSSQINAAYLGEKVVPAFTIELLSDSESFEDVANKIQDYFDAGVALVWYISPKNKTIYAYTSTKDIKVYTGTDKCTANPVLSDFSFITEDLFKIG